MKEVFLALLVLILFSSFVFAQGFGACGDGIVQSPNSYGIEEECDDGNLVNGDGCSDDCRLNDFDGDGIRDRADKCFFTPSSSNADSDRDGRGDACDLVSNHAVKSNFDLWVQELGLDRPGTWVRVTDKKKAHKVYLDFVRTDISKKIDFSTVTVNLFTSVLGGVIVEVKGLALLKGESKSVHLFSNLSTNKVCVADFADVKLEDVPISIEDCIEPYVLLDCPGNSDKYQCSVKGREFRISGLNHSILVELSSEPAPKIKVQKPAPILIEPELVELIVQTPIVEQVDVIAINSELQSSESNVELTSESIESTRASGSAASWLFIMGLIVVVFILAFMMFHHNNSSYDD